MALSRDAVATAFRELDNAVVQSGFSRKARRGEVYRRELPEANQEIDVSVRLNPKYAAGSEVHVYPMLRIGFPTVSRVAVEMLGDAQLLADAADVAVMQPLDSVAPPASRVRWLAMGDDGLQAVFDEVAGFISTWGLPFLDEYSSVAGYVAGYERDDQRLMFQQHSFVFVAAAYVVLGSHEKAMEVLRQRLGSMGLRARFGRAFDYLESVDRQ